MTQVSTRQTRRTSHVSVPPPRTRPKRNVTTPDIQPVYTSNSTPRKSPEHTRATIPARDSPKETPRRKALSPRSTSTGRSSQDTTHKRPTRNTSTNTTDMIQGLPTPQKTTLQQGTPSAKRRRTDQVEMNSDSKTTRITRSNAGTPTRITSDYSTTCQDSPKLRDISNTSQDQRRASHKAPKLTPHQVARALLMEVPSHLTQRDNEHEIITKFLKQHIDEQSGGSMYISGVPGTGKTASVDQCIASLKGRSMRTVRLNCMSLAKEISVINKLRCLLNLTECEEKSTSKNGIEADQVKLSNFFLRKAQKSYVVVLDEIDHLVAVNQSEHLYWLFEIAQRANSSLIIIGIANALDLTETFLPRLESKSILPTLLSFQPYNTNQLIAIITAKLARLKVANDTPDVVVMPPKVIEFCARKVSAVTGDLRKAVDICCLAIEISERECKQALTESKPPCLVVSLQHVLQAVKASTSNTTVSRIAPLNLHQKIVLVCCVVKMKGGDKEWDLGTIHTAYSQLLSSLKLVAPLGRADLTDLIMVLESSGLVTVSSSKGTKKMRMDVAPLDVIKGVQDMPTLYRIAEPTSEVNRSPKLAA